MKKLLLTSGCLLGLVVSQVANAISVDLTTAGATGYANGGYFQQISPQSTGTGVIDPFLRIQANGTEQGFNNSVDKFTLDNVAKGGQNYNHDILLSEVPIVTIGSVNYYQFLLDINESKGGDEELLSLHELEIWLKSTAITTLSNPKGTYSDLTGSGAVKAWDLDNGSDGDSVIELNFILNPGSGAGDMFANIPVSALGTDGSKYVYLYSAFGNPKTSSDGFEEWALLKSKSTPVPDSGMTAALLGLGMLGLGFLARRKA